MRRLETNTNDGNVGFQIAPMIDVVFVIMLVLTRALIAAAAIVGTVALSLGASFGLSVLCWQYLLGIQLHWLVLAMSVIVLFCQPPWLKNVVQVAL